jgi:cytochrome b
MDGNPNRHENDAETPAGMAPVWDAALRVFHWALAGAVVAALLLGFFSPKRWLDYHLWTGYAALALVAFRLIWGTTGPTHARFSSFAPSPRAILSQLAGRRQAGYGHNPLGALMVYALLALVLAAAISGLWALGGVLRQGPLAPFLAFASGRAAKEIHELLAFALIGFIGLHVAGVVFESWREKENLARAMVTGRKRARADGARIHAARPVATTLAIFGLAAIAAGAFAWTGSIPIPFIPSGPALASWKTECGDCHTPHHPSLLPAASWARIMAALDDHFGEDASLEAAKAEEIRAWLAAHAAEHYDTRAANSFRAPDADEPLRITATARWKRIHGEIPAETYKRKNIGGPANCGACHGDAEAGLFAPQRIRIPDPAQEPS